MDIIKYGNIVYRIYNFIIYYDDEDGNITNIKTYNENGAIVDMESNKIQINENNT